MGLVGAAHRAYLQQMAGLIAQNGLANADNRDTDGDTFDDSPIAGLARSLTMTVLRQLDGSRKGHVAQFLAQSGLIKNKGVAVVNLYGADLRDAVLFDAFLSNTSFIGADLQGADLRYSWIDGANFTSADLRDTNLAYTAYDPKGVQRSYFDASCLTGARFTAADLPDASFDGAHGSDVDFSKASLTGGDFTDAVLMDVEAAGTKYGAATPKTFPPGWGRRGLSKQIYEDQPGPCDDLDIAESP